MSRKIRILLLSLIFQLPLSAQLVNIESKRMQTDSIRFVLKTDLLFNYSDNDGNYLFQIGGGIATQWKSWKCDKILYFIGNYDLVRSKAQDFSNSWFFHLRYNQKLSNFWRLEAFLQNQNNELLTINSRNLIGAGIRMKFVSTDQIKAYFGNSYMYESEMSNFFDRQFYNHRNSSYFSITVSLGDSKLDLTNTVYFQPLYRDIGNHRVLEQLKAEIPISKDKKLKASGLFNYFLNSRTPDNSSEYSSFVRVGLTFEI